MHSPDFLHHDVVLIAVVLVTCRIIECEPISCVVFFRQVLTLLTVRSAVNLKVIAQRAVDVTAFDDTR